MEVTETQSPRVLICRLVIDDLRAAPWGVYTRGDRSPDKIRFKGWQSRVAAEARLATDMRKMAYRGPVAMRLTFFTGPLTGNQQVMDATNLQKAAEDAVKAIVFEDDRQVWDIHTTRLEADRDCTVIEVYAAGPPATGRVDP